jgi:hypothetical protein
MANDDKKIEETDIENLAVENILEGPGDEVAIKELLQQIETKEEFSRFDESESEPASGVIKLASMVAKAGAIATPSAERVRFETAISDIPPPIHSLSQRKIIVPVFAIMAIIFICAVIAILVLQKRKTLDAREVEMAKFALLQAQVRQAEAQREIVEKSTASGKIAPPETQAQEEEIEEEEAAEKEPASQEEDTGALESEKDPSKTASKKSTGKKRSRRSARSSKVSPQEARGSSDRGLSKRPGREDISAAMGPVAREATACSKYASGTVQLRITVASDGKVEKCRSLGGFADTRTGKCVEDLAKTAKFHKFEDQSFTFTYPITVR